MMMKAAVLRGEDARLVVESVPVPRPGPGEALIRVAACGVCHTDLHVMRNEVAFPRPAVLGHEVSGTVVEINGESAAGVENGSRVVAGFIMPCSSCDACERGRDDMCAKFFEYNRLRGVLYDGTSRLADRAGASLAMYSMAGLAQYAVVPISALAPIPDDMDLEAACVLGCAGLTSYGAVFRAGRVTAGEKVAVIGIGGVGSSLVQMARAAGASQIVAIDVLDDKLSLARGLGATDVVNAAGRDPVEEIRRVTGGGADVVFEALGRPLTFEQGVRALADGGRLVAIGIAAGNASAQVEITPLVRRGYTIVGSFGGRTRTDLPKVVELARDGAYASHELISRRFSLDEVDDAYQALGRGEIVGRAIITM